MRAAVRSDRVTRTIVVEVTGVPDIDLTQSYHKRPRSIRPSTVRITWANGEVSMIAVDGGLVLKSGQASTEIVNTKRWWGYDIVTRTPMVPAWLRTLVNEAAQGVTSWYYPDSENPAEVLPL